MKIGTKSVLYGAHCFFLHPWFVARSWWKLYGFPFDPRLWFAFFLHDIGYIGKPNMDGPEGEKHPEVGARIMSFLFDKKSNKYWHDFTLYHSRYYAKKAGKQPSKLCFADKIAITITPRWLYLPMTKVTGELNEYLKNAETAENPNWIPTNYDTLKWHRQLCHYMTQWVELHKDGLEDTWTDANRHDYK